MPGLDRLHRVGGAFDRRLGNLAGVGVAGRLAGNGAQAEALVGVETRRLQPAVVEHQALGLRVLEIKLAVVGALERVGDQPAGPFGVEPGPVENGVGCSQEAAPRPIGVK